MTKSNDMSESYSVKVSLNKKLTEKLPYYRHPPTNHHNSAKHHLPLTIKGGEYHV